MFGKDWWGFREIWGLGICAIWAPYACRSFPSLPYLSHFTHSHPSILIKSVHYRTRWVMMRRPWKKSRLIIFNDKLENYYIHQGWVIDSINFLNLFLLTSYYVILILCFYYPPIFSPSIHFYICKLRGLAHPLHQSVSVLRMCWHRSDPWIENVLQTMLSHKMVWCDSQAFLHVVLFVSRPPHLSQVLQWVQIFPCFFNVSDQLLFFNVKSFEQFLGEFRVWLCERQYRLAKVLWNIFCFVSSGSVVLSNLTLLFRLLFTLNVVLAIWWCLLFDNLVRFRRMNIGFLDIDVVGFFNFDQNVVFGALLRKLRFFDFGE